MRMRIALTLLMLSLLPISALADLTGSDVTATLFFPNLTTVFAGPQGPVVVGAGIEFPALAFDGTLDVSGNQIIWTATLQENYGGGAFNGFDLVFSGAPTITNVSLDGATTLTPVGFALLNGDEVQLNLEGLSAKVGDKTILDVTTSTNAVPEPETRFLTLLLLALIALVSLRSARFGHR